MNTSDLIIPMERLAQKIYFLRGQNVMLDFDLAEIYGIETKVLNQSATRNSERFPDDFMFQLTEEEFDNLKSQIVTSSWGGRRSPLRAFTELGVSMLSSVLRSPKAVEINIGIMRSFVHLRRMLAGNEELARKINEHDYHIGKLYEELNKLLIPPDVPPKNPMGFQAPKTKKKA